MKIINLNKDSKEYTSNVYLILGTWNTMEDINTLVDVGRDPIVIDKILNAPTGVGKTRIEQVILTHTHYDHVGILPLIREKFSPVVYAFSSMNGLVDHILKGGEKLKIGDRIFEIIHTPGHSNDSICLYCEKDRVLFTGDTPVVIQSAGGTYEESFISALERLEKKEIEDIYFGHGDPIIGSGNKVIQNSLQNIKST